MPSKKTAISIERPLFNEVEALAEEMDVSRSYLFSLAAREFIQRHKSQKLLDAINDAYSGPTGAEEKKLRTRMQAKYRKLIDEW